ncbi:MAG: nucleotidyltransferase domain-containing protein [Eubacteriales bacterium]|nr:nucleotidyltransferase domain-containing protein [Eubacteriales bacterium]
MSEYYTVTQFAEITRKDPGNIRRLLAYGRLAGEKLGKQWVIPKDAVYPEDGRVKSGNYRNWRKRPGIWQDNPDLMKALLHMSNDLEKVYGEYLVKIVLYGSYARGEQTVESDVDIAVILKDGNTEQMHDEMTDVVVDYELDQGVTLSVIPIEFEQYKAWNKTLPFYKNIDKEGIVLWKAA